MTCTLPHTELGIFNISLSLCEWLQVSVCSNPDVLNNTRYALEKASEILKFYETYFGIPYPLPKQGVCVCVRVCV